MMAELDELVSNRLFPTEHADAAVLTLKKQKILAPPVDAAQGTRLPTILRLISA
jgi:hypothetical protein